jgi:ATP-dependent DNA helicase RecG
MVFSDRVEVWNSGSLPPELSVEDLQKPHTSFPANPLIANALYLADYAQRAGSGTVEMVEQCRAEGAPEPDFVLIRNVEFRSILPRDVFTVEVLAKMGLNERQLKAVKYIKEKGQITNKEYQELNSVSKATATRELSKLVGLKVLKQQGVVGKGTFYRLG